MTCKEAHTTVWNGWCPSGSTLHTALARQVIVTGKDGMLLLGRMFVLACHNSLDRL